MLAKLYHDNFMEQITQNLSKLMQQFSNQKAAIFIVLFIDFVHQFGCQEIWLANPLTLSTLVWPFLYKTPLSLSFIIITFFPRQQTHFSVNVR